jgi:hypothetical protein
MLEMGNFLPTPQGVMKGMFVSTSSIRNVEFGPTVLFFVKTKLLKLIYLAK